jgi:hypothetical protein
MAFLDTTPQAATSAMPNMVQMLGSVGPATGYQAANQVENSNALMGQALQQGQMGLDANQLLLNKMQADVPLQDLQRQLATLQTQSDINEQPLVEATKKSDLETKQSTNDATQLSNKEKKQAAMGQAAEEMDNVLGDNTSIPLQNRQAINQRWEQMGFPPLPTDPTEARDRIKQYAEWNRNNAERLKAAAAQKSAQEVAKINATSRENVAQTNLQGHVYTADQRVEAAKVRATIAAAMKSGDPKTIEGVAAQIVQKIRNGEEVSDYERGIADFVFGLKAAGAKQSPGGQVAGLTSGLPSAVDATVSNPPKVPGGPSAAPAPSAPKPMPKSAADAIDGEVYMTSKGPATWNAKTQKFTPVQ